MAEETGWECTWPWEWLWIRFEVGDRTAFHLPMGLGMDLSLGLNIKRRLGLGSEPGVGVEDRRQLRLATRAGCGLEVGGEVRVGCRAGVRLQKSIPRARATHGAPFSPRRQQPGRPLRLMQ